MTLAYLQSAAIAVQRAGAGRGIALAALVDALATMHERIDQGPEVGAARPCAVAKQLLSAARDAISDVGVVAMVLSVVEIGRTIGSAESAVVGIVIGKIDKSVLQQRSFALIVPTVPVFAVRAVATAPCTTQFPIEKLHVVHRLPRGSSGAGVGADAGAAIKSSPIVRLPIPGGAGSGCGALPVDARSAPS